MNVLSAENSTLERIDAIIYILLPPPIFPPSTEWQ